VSNNKNGAQMAWNDNNNQTPPELDEVIKDFKNKFNSTFGGKSSGNSGASKAAKGSFKYIFILAFIVWLATGIYIVDPAERGVVLRFGAFQTSATKGPHWHIPYPIESVYKINVEQIRSAEIGFRNVQNSYGGGVSSESLMLTKDENMVDVKLAVQYKVADAQAFLFNVFQPELTLSHVVQSVIRQVVGDNTMDYVLTTGREQVAQEVKVASQALLNEYNTGLMITAVTMQDAQPPVNLKQHLMMLLRRVKMSSDTLTRPEPMQMILFQRLEERVRDFLQKLKHISQKWFQSLKVRRIVLIKY
jgi:membrane protease subunit HflK